MTAMAQRLLVASACLALIGCGRTEPPNEHYPHVDPDDPSVELDKPFPTTTGKVNQNGTAFDRSQIDLTGARVLWVPDVADRSEVEVSPTGEAGRVVVDLEKKWFDGSHTAEGTDIRQTRKRVEVRVARTAEAVVVAVSRGWGHRHGGMRVIARFRVSPGVRVERGEPPQMKCTETLMWELVSQAPVPITEGRK